MKQSFYVQRVALRAAQSIAFFYLALIMMSSNQLNAQKISGTVLLPDGKPAEFTAVMLMRAKDSTLAKGAVTDEKGKYEMEGMTTGRYFLSVSLVGYPKFLGQPFDFKKEDLTLDVVKLQAESTELQVVTIKAQKPFIEVKADKMVMNVESSITSAGANGMELLQKAPGVVIDNNDNISLKGKNGVQIWIDGKPSQMEIKDLAAYLRSLNANDIEAIEIITNPSARFDAAGNAGIINIRLKKNKNLGTNGSIGANFRYGIAPKGDVSINLNHRNKKLNVFGNAGYNNGEWHNSMTFYREQNDKIFDQHQKQISYHPGGNLKIGADYFANSKHTFGILATGNMSTGSWRSISQTFIAQAATSQRVDSVLDATNTIAVGRQNMNFNANYRFADTSGHELTVDLDKGFFKGRGESFQPNYYKTPDFARILTQRIFSNNTPTNIDITSLKADYTQKLFKKAQLGAGFKVAKVTTDNTFDFFNVAENGTPTKDVTRSNQFIYTEQVNAAYLNLNTPLSSKVSLQAGLRMEQTQSVADLRRDPSQAAKPNDKVARDYTDFFPSAALTFNIHPKHTLNLTYSRRIDRPSYQDLNPFENKLDELTFQRGNAFLQPQYANNVELTYTLMQAVNINVGFSRTKNMFTEIIEKGTAADELNYTYVTNRNLSRQDNINFGISSPTPIKKWWNGFVNISAYSSRFVANLPEYQFDQRVPFAWNLYAEQNWTLPKGFTLSASGWYNSPAIWGGTMRSRQQGSFDMGLQKKIWEGRGNLRLSVTDIFFTAPWGGVTDVIPGLRMTARGQWESRQVRLNFSYRFGNKEVKGARQRETGSESEKNRIKN
jgi:5-hydroxyisourate hydrolase-like protein (transthyretin family)